MGDSCATTLSSNLVQGTQAIGFSYNELFLLPKKKFELLSLF